MDTEKTSQYKRNMIVHMKKLLNNEKERLNEVLNLLTKKSN